MPGLAWLVSWPQRQQATGGWLPAAVCDQGMEGVVAKRRSQAYRPTGVTPKKSSLSGACWSADTRCV